MSEADAVYDAGIKDLAAKAEKLGPVEHATCRREADNFLCGDRATVEIGMDGDRVRAVGGRIRGCLLVQAAAALIAETAPGMDRDALGDGIEQARRLLAGDGPASGAWEGLNVFTPVQGLKHRHECVLLPFEAMQGCLNEADGDKD